MRDDRVRVGAVAVSGVGAGVRLAGVPNPGRRGQDRGVAIGAEPSDSPGTMLHLNAFLARRGMSARFLDREEVEAFDVGDLPRYRIIKLVLLEELDQSRL